MYVSFFLLLCDVHYFFRSVFCYLVVEILWFPPFCRWLVRSIMESDLFYFRFVSVYFRFSFEKVFFFQFFIRHGRFNMIFFTIYFKKFLLILWSIFTSRRVCFYRGLYYFRFFSLDKRELNWCNFLFFDNLSFYRYYIVTQILYTSTFCILSYKFSTLPPLPSRVFSSTEWCVLDDIINFHLIIKIYMYMYIYF